MVKKTSAHYQREFRKRLRDQGLIKKEVWIKPDNAGLLAEIEKTLRNDVPQQKIGDFIDMNNSLKNWTTTELYNALLEHDLVKSGKASIENVEPSIIATMHDFGDLPIYIGVSGQQIVAESVLWSVNDVSDVAEFNECVLLTHKYFPLSTISLEKVGGVLDYYNMFGALSSSSGIENIILELETLASNVLNAADAFGDFLK